MVHRAAPSKVFLTVLGSPVRRVTASNVPPTPVTTTNTGVIEVYDSQDNLMGYVSKNMVDGRQYGYDPSLANALSVTFDTDQTGSGTQLNIRTTVCAQAASFSGFFSPPTISEFESKLAFVGLYLC